jgi:hypothetical protein
MLLCTGVAGVGLVAALLFCPPIRAEAEKILLSSPPAPGIAKAQPELPLTKAAEEVQATARSLWAKASEMRAPHQAQQAPEPASAAAPAERGHQSETNEVPSDST